MSGAPGNTAAVAERVVAVATVTTSRGSSAAIATQQAPIATTAAAQGIAGPPGASAAVPTSYSIAAAASFTAAHGLPFAPETWIVTPDGELVETDIRHAPGATTAIFAEPFTGTLYLR